MHSRSLLIAEDDDLVREVIEYCVEVSNCPIPVRFADNGAEALRILRQDADAPGGWAILTDIRMPMMDGFQLLDAVRSDPDLRDSPAMVFSSSDAPEDVAAAYDRGVLAYFVKGQRRTDMIALLEDVAGLIAANETPRAPRLAVAPPAHRSLRAG